MEQGIQTDQWVRKAAEPPPTFDPRRERDTYKKARKETVRNIMGSIDFTTCV
jgi:hypothetical protein